MRGVGLRVVGDQPPPAPLAARNSACTCSGQIADSLHACGACNLGQASSAGRGRGRIHAAILVNMSRRRRGAAQQTKLGKLFVFQGGWETWGGVERGKERCSCQSSRLSPSVAPPVSSKAA